MRKLKELVKVVTAELAKYHWILHSIINLCHGCKKENAEEASVVVDKIIELLQQLELQGPPAGD